MRKLGLWETPMNRSDGVNTEQRLQDRFHPNTGEICPFARSGVTDHGCGYCFGCG